MNDLVSVYILNHNYSAYLDECIGSLVDQSYKNIEIIIIDTNICYRALRFLPYDDNIVSIWLSRDLDSVVNDREKDAVNEWISKYPDKNLHIICL